MLPVGLFLYPGASVILQTGQKEYNRTILFPTNIPKSQQSAVSLQSTYKMNLVDTNMQHLTQHFSDIKAILHTY